GRAASSIATADATASPRSRSTSIRTADAMMTIIGSATSTPSQTRGYLIAPLLAGGEFPAARGHHDVAQPSIDLRQAAGQRIEGRDHQPIEKAIEESAL